MKSGPKLVRSKRSNTLRGPLDLVAAALGVPVARFSQPVEPFILHAEPDGARWLLLCDAEGTPIVRCVDTLDAGSIQTDEPIWSLLTRNETSPQRTALMALMEHLLVANITSRLPPPA